MCDRAYAENALSKGGIRVEPEAVVDNPGVSLAEQASFMSLAHEGGLIRVTAGDR